MRLLGIALAVAGAALGLAACSDSGTTGPGSDPTLEAVTPSAGATGVDPAGPITVRFSGPMGTGMEQYVDLHQGDIGGPLVQASCAWSADRNTLTCTPAAPLQPGTGYTIHMGLGMMNASGRPVETEERGRQMGGQPVTGQMMGGMHGGQASSMVGPGWRHAGDDHVSVRMTPADLQYPSHVPCGTLQQVLRPGLAESLAAGFEGAEEPTDSEPAQLARGRRGAR